MAKAFAMRLMHLGLPVYVIGETTTPSVAGSDTLVAVSGSGTTGGTVRVAEQADALGATVWAVTTDPDSPLGLAAAEAAGDPRRHEVPARRRGADHPAAVQPVRPGHAHRAGRGLPGASPGAAGSTTPRAAARTRTPSDSSRRDKVADVGRTGESVLA